jgi:hypothetical protein
MGGDNDVATSPFTLVFKNAGLAFAASFMNAVISDNTEVKITAFINEAANANPAFLKTSVNGDVATSSIVMH